MLTRARGGGLLGGSQGLDVNRFVNAPAAPAWASLGAMWNPFRASRKKMRKGKPKKNKTEEMVLCKPNVPIRREDHLGKPKTPYQMAKEIGTHVARLTTDGKNCMRRKKDFTFRNKNRVMRFARLTHDHGPFAQDNKGGGRFEKNL